MDARSLGLLMIGAAVVAAALAAAAARAQTADTSECRACGRVVSIRASTAVERWEPLGSAVTSGPGAEVGGPGSTQPSAVTSFKIGKGGKNEGMVLLGSAGGANYKTSTSYERKGWEVTVKLDSGETRIVQLRYEPYVHEGDRVRIAGNNVELVD